MKLPFLLLSHLIAIVIALPATATAQSVKTGPAPLVVENNDSKFEVSVDSGGKDIEVRAIKAEEPLPSRMVLALRKGDQLLERVEVKPMELNPENTRFKGRLKSMIHSFIGIQIEIELDPPQKH